MADSEFLFKAEYAKSDRSSCKKCRQKIGKGALRMAKMVQSPHFDGKVPNWYHYPCFWKLATVTVSTQIAGFNGLRWNDQEKIKQKITGDVSGETVADKVVSKESQLTDFTVEYAKSDRSKCRVCNEKIAKDEIRMGYNEPQDGGKKYQTWHHLGCFCDPVKLVEMGWQKEFKADDVKGFKALKAKDQKVLQKKLVLKPADVKRKLGITESDSPAKKKAKTETQEDKAMREQSQFLWKIRDQLSRYVAVKALKELLEVNNQYPPKGEHSMLDAVADGMTFGALERCPECKGGQLVIRSDGYHCTGNLTSWTKCMYTSTEPAKKSSWVIPDDFKEIKFMKDFKFKPFNKGVRVFTEVAPVPSTSSAAVAAPPPDKPLQNVKVGLIGKLSKTNKNVTKEIEDLGGKVVTKVDSTVACCISTQAEVKKMSKKMKDAKSADVHIVSEDFLENIKKGGAALMITKLSIASWGADPAARINSNMTQVDAGPSKDDLEELKYKKDVDTLKMMVKGGAAVDPDSGIQDTAHVYNIKDLIYNATLGMVDIMRGTNSFYKLQLLEHDNGDQWYLFRSWGRVGTTIGGNKLEKFSILTDATSQFQFVYKEKTGNDFRAKEFKKYPNKFFPLEIDYGEDEDQQVDTLKAGSGSLLPRAVQDLMVMIFDIDTMKKTMVEFEIDLKKMPLGKLSKRQIESAYSVLSEALKLMEGGGNTKAAILDCSNRFYTLIPHDFGLKKPKMLDDVELIKSKTQMLDNLLDIEVAYSLLKGGSKKGKDPIDANYEKLRCSINPVGKKSADFKMVEKFISNSNDAKSSLDLEVLDVFEIEREDEPKKFKSLHNRRLLWHGSRVSNFAGILSQGLRIAPPEAPQSGYLFGKGIYFADMVAKSMWYCRTSKSDNVGLMLLCDVALGDMYEIPHTEYMDKAPSGKHSTRGIGRVEPDPKQSLKKDGYVVPYGKPKSTGVGRSYNEFIVYDITQVQMKYLIKIDFKHRY